MKPIYKFNNGRGATLCHLCRAIISTGRPTDDLYCSKCLNDRTQAEKEFNRLTARTRITKDNINIKKTI